MEEDEALEAFVGADEQIAREAYSRLCENSRSFLDDYLRKCGCGTPADREDIISNA